MSKETKIKTLEETPINVNRIYEQPSDASSFYADVGQVINTGNEIILQFYETIPGPPTFEGEIQDAKTRLRATITLSMQHAQNIGNVLIKKTKTSKK